MVPLRRMPILWLTQSSQFPLVHDAVSIECLNKTTHPGTCCLLLLVSKAKQEIPVVEVLRFLAVLGIHYTIEQKTSAAC